MVDLKVGDIVTADIDGWREGRVITEHHTATRITSEKKYDLHLDEFYLEVVIE